MKLTREEIDGVTFTCIRHRYYLAVEVDRCLDELANEADKNTQLIQELQKQVEKLQALVKASASEDSAAIISRANERAQAIIRQGEQKSNELINSATVQKNRVTAASRAAYYNALQFKQDLATHYRQMEMGLDASLDILSRVENTQPLSSLPDPVEEAEKTPAPDEGTDAKPEEHNG